ncbi:hypothetical protein DTO164E3_3934 [Paecilomyces variotii]|nr:hypothetical protein DTO032I3_5706 [Paecilomyces variotii]KAJ9200784.1 hypothetical protein DTO164E3_3934 [Paecilomyces variotii]KAJ9220528.1 hypothetical protein DTO169C6_7156 [Paecilomyces variotii]KAJ9264710.1 hypothetical protein DTO195F2_2161 [Paecilomyces variotii]KAJ9276917.1 hypothetical protein DTO021D3_6195 [Paecilomyces variotii]
MPPNKKKKKPASNPARGFATVSVPSKIKTTDSPTVSSAAESTAASDVEKSQPVPVSEPAAAAATAAPEGQALKDYSPEDLEKHLEEAELQLLVDKYASKCKSDSARQVAKLETERRVLRPQANTLSLTDWLSPEILDQLLNLAQKEQHETDPPPAYDSNESKGPTSEEDLCVRVWTLRETLLKLGFPEPKIQEALKHILVYFSGNPTSNSKDVIWNLEESLEWLAMNCDPNELPPYLDKAPAPKGSDMKSSWLNEIEQPRSSTPSIASQTDAAVKKPKSQPTVASVPDFDLDDSDGSLDPDNLTPEFLNLRTQLYNLQPDHFDQPKKGKKGQKGSERDSDPQVAKIKYKLSKIENDILFDQAEAEDRWKDILVNLRREAAFVRKAAESRPEDSAAQRITDEAEKIAEEELAAMNSPQAEDESLGLFGDMFSAEGSTTELTAQAGPAPANIQVRNFGKWTGLSPRRVFEDACKARDANCKVTYKDISLSSYSNRKAVEVKWSKPQDTPLPLTLDVVTLKSNPYVVFASMDTIATQTSQEAEGYVSTLALFLIFGQSSKESKAYLRLPAVWRDLWGEFASLRKEQEDESDKKTVRGLKYLIQECTGKSEHDVVLTHNFRKRNGNGGEVEPSTKQRPSGNVGPSDELASIWRAKASTPAFNRMVQSRMNLPIWAYKDEILKTLDSHQAIIICSETGSGKSTQIPSFILEHELIEGRNCKIYVTEPRRISAISLARRVSEELGENKNDIGTSRSLVGYAIRLESKLTQSTKLVYATTGVVVRMLERPQDFQDISHVVLDEVHERTIDSDFLLIILRRLMQQRPDLKLVLMSATVDAQRFSSYLGGVPVLNIPGRTFPVEVKYLEDAIEMTNYRLLDDQSSALDDDVAEPSPDSPGEEGAGGLGSTLEGYSKQTRDTVTNFDEYRLDYHLITRLLAKIATDPNLEWYSKAILVFMPGMAEIRRLNDEILSDPAFGRGWIVHALHSSIPSEDQEKAFLVPPEGTRKIVIATNIAETGITIPDITAVIDAGKEKVMRFDERRQLSRLVESFISRANAKQRRGRAGRVQTGICFHLFTKHRHDSLLAEQQTPEMLRLSLQDLVLRVKICNLGDVEQTLLEALDPPSSKNIRRAIDSLKEVKALTNSETLTPLGRQLAKLPLDVFLGKLIIYGAFFKCLDASVSIAAILSSKSPFVNTMGSNTQKELARLSFKKGDSDLLTVYNAYCAWKRIRNSPGINEYSFCRSNFLSPQALLSIEDIKMQLLVSIADTGLMKLDDTEQASLKRARFSGRQRQFFVVPERFDVNSASDLVVTSVIAWSFYPKLLSREGKGWRNVSNNQAVSLHPTSVNKQADASIKWLSFYHIMQARNKFYNAHETSAVDDFAVALLCGEAEFKLYAGIISIDNNRIRFSVKDWKSILALKILGSKVREILSGTFKNPQKPLSHRQQEWMNILQQMFTDAYTSQINRKGP